MKAETARLPQARQDELFIEQLGDELVVYDAKRFCAHRLNRTAAWMWRHCDGRKTVADTTRLLASELQQPVDEELVWLSLETLDKAHLLSTPIQRPSGAPDDSRRALMQKLAVAGGLMLLLPVITPLTRPAEAQGGTPLVVNYVVPAGAKATTPAIKGTIDRGAAIKGESGSGAGISGASTTGSGVEGYSNQSVGVKGDAVTKPGVQGKSEQGDGVYGSTYDTGGKGNSSGVKGEHPGTGVGVTGASQRGYGVAAYSASGTALYAESLNGGRAGFFKGDVEVTGDIRLTNADCAEDFDIVDAETIEAGSVMVLCDEGALQLSQTAYDRRVAGVISGAGDYKPGLILDKRPSDRPRKPVALMGKVFCKADASYGAIEAGDLLTTSDTPGHVMKAGNPARAFGAVVGKALRALPEGQGLIPILVSLQ